MFLTFDDGVNDFDLEILEELAVVLDQQIARVEESIEMEPLAFDLGYFDRLESVIGLGMVACQQYISATCPRLPLSTAVQKHVLLDFPPVHTGGCSIAKIVNAAANYWKHSDEWPDPHKETEEKRVRAVLETVVEPADEYALREILQRLVAPEPARLSNVVRLLVGWRDGHVRTMSQSRP